MESTGEAVQFTSGGHSTWSPQVRQYSIVYKWWAQYMESTSETVQFTSGGHSTWSPQLR
jgi:hypothetical protein